MMSKNRLLSLDPSTSCTGWAVFHDGKLLEAGSIKADPKCSRWERQKYIADQLLLMLENQYPYFEIYNNSSLGYTVVSEEPMVQGRNGLALHKFLGAIEVLFSIPVNYVHPSTVKRIMGSGKLDKFEVALAAGRLLKTDQEQEKMAKLISNEDFDATDAVAIGLCWMEMSK